MGGGDDRYRMFVADSGLQWQGPAYLPTDCPPELRVEMACERILNDFVYPFVNSGTDALVFRVDAGNQFLCYDTRVGEPVTAIQSRLEKDYGLTPRSAGGPEYVSFPHALGWWRLAENFRLFQEHGFDPWTTIIEAAHRQGIEVFLELQMNRADPAIHYLDGSGVPGSRFALEHSEYLLGYDCHRTDLSGTEAGAYRPMYQSPAPDGDTHSKPETAFCQRLDFGHKEVRELRLATIEELCRRYEIDGLELNFCFDPHFFRKDQVDGARIMSEFMSSAKARMAKIGTERGRSIRLLARFFVHKGLEFLHHQVGLDVTRWIDDKSVDILAPVGSTTAVEHVGGVADCVTAARGTDCQVLGCFSEIMSDQFTQIRPSTEMLQAANSLYRSAGVDGLHVWWPRYQSVSSDFQQPEDYSLLRDLKSSSSCARFDKHHLLFDQLPQRLEEGQQYAVELEVGDDLESAYAQGAIEKIILVIGLRHFTANDDVVFSCNGNTIPPEDFIEPDFPLIWYCVGRLEISLQEGSLKQGKNEIGIRVNRHVPDAEGMTLDVDDPRRPDQLIFTNLELIIKYGEAKANGR